MWGSKPDFKPGVVVQVAILDTWKGEAGGTSRSLRPLCTTDNSCVMSENKSAAAQRGGGVLTWHLQDSAPCSQ